MCQRTCISSTTVRIKFDDWSGLEDVLTPCMVYPNELKVVIDDGRK
ncbi:MAG: hypothetical protein ACYC27_08550 [Armatimonadota bacterium]